MNNNLLNYHVGMVILGVRTVVYPECSKVDTQTVILWTECLKVCICLSPNMHLEYDVAICHDLAMQACPGG